MLVRFARPQHTLQILGRSWVDLFTTEGTGLIELKIGSQ